MDAKREYLWGDISITDIVSAIRCDGRPTYLLIIAIMQMDKDVATIRLDEVNTVRTLRDKLQESLAKGYAGSGLPIVRRDVGGMKMVGYIGMNELEHALGEFENILSNKACSGY